MTPADTTAFRAALRRLETAFGCPVDDARDPVFFDALANFPITTVITAARNLEREPPPSRRMPTTHDWADRCREVHRAHLARAGTRPPARAWPDDDTPPMSQAEFLARLDTLRKKLARVRPGAHRHSSLIPLSQIADSLTHPRAIPDASAVPGARIPSCADAEPSARPREPGDDDLPLDDEPTGENDDV